MPTFEISRQDIIDTLHKGLADSALILAAWLGGSDASGRTDEYSDIDMQVIVEDDHVEETFDLVHKILDDLSPTELRYRFPEPTWHGHSQELLRLRGTDPNHMLDFVVMKKSIQDRLLEPERHGVPLILFDRGVLLEPPSLDWKAHREKMGKRLADLRVTFPLLQPLVTRGVHRRHIAESALAYQVLTMKPLVELLRMRYCPERYDYSLRYLDRDLPDDVRKEIEILAYPQTPEHLLKLHHQAVGRFRQQLDALDRSEWGLPSPE
ncbi:MAG: nucleotidyltransferase domain-containing protein [Candidatus Eisenbacteria bacterium]|uniref:Nucleotidyltransferase domain-containing protein n=1 Tax=Eiseniibacteriota bacterium TaxID=2212470 RepID=A0A948RTM7_UNCEI|nr:nucleotidyltransferase domain-containing protein [Candidatus Eisenbacteria bacterium]MBU1949811.1 nucleotidyltransferase domain-containing protein [Candidatus Eisenbacteria bacterium]MBU2690798.1 nucleotidyltransferase domain-containing protein [Candidatus Eisenbacteria bacterium]